jgi:signal transduction histidine kinase
MRRRILQSTLLVVAITALVLGGPLAFTTWQLVSDFSRSDLRSRLEQIVATLDDKVNSSTIDLSPVAVAVPPDGRLTVDSPLAGRISIGGDPGEDAIRESVPIGQGAEAELAVPATDMRSRQVQLLALVILLVSGSVVVGVIVGVMTARRLTGPMSDVAQRAARLGGGDFRPQPRRHGIPELDRVADVLDSSAGALASLVKRERELVGDVSHQLRSRLTALQLRLDELAAHPDPDAAAEASAALEQTDRLSAVLEELLRAARVARAAGAEPVDLTEQLRVIAGEWREPLRTAGRVLRLRVADGLLARATPARFREAVGVLLDNAARHGDGTVTLLARTGEGTVVVEVSDAGPGVPAGLVPHVFDRGVSGGASTGVGLALARALVEADGGRLELRQARTATFAIYLPVPRAADLVQAPRPATQAPR